MNKIGVADYGLNVWYGGCFNLEQRLDLMKQCGVEGIERLTATDTAEALQNAFTFHRLGMDFVTCNVGSVEMSMRCTSAFGKDYVWLALSKCTRDVPFETFCRRAKEFVKAASYYNVKVALHNHLGSCAESQKEVEDFMDQIPEAMLLLDIGHLHAAGGNNVEVIKKYHNRLAAVHFKDVFYKDMTKGLDVWWERLRFCELNGGNAGMELEPIVKALKDAHYSKWLLIEHDTHLHEPEIDLKKSADILKDLFR